VVGDSVTMKNGVLLWSGVTIEEGVFLGPSAVFTTTPAASIVPKGSAGWRPT
jgi:UDP-2-acetamido-3-amino-2,3-dideoxy-glucuronate N-acetyltransferase